MQMIRGRQSIFAWLLTFAVVAPASAQSTTPAPTASESQPVPAAIIPLRDEINEYSRTSFQRRFQHARQNGAKLIIIDLDTYGGAVTAALELSQFIKSQTDVRTIAYVNSKAYSAGAMIAMACNQIVMTPVAALGDCAPIA